MENKLITFEDIKKANEIIKPISIERKDKETGKKVIKKYAEVNQRIKAFRIVYPMGTIETELLKDDDNICMFRANIYNGEVLLATATAREEKTASFINKTNYVENCETSAVGRALGMCGFGIDVSVASAEEVQNAINNQEPTQEEADNYTLTFGKHQGKKLKDVPTDYLEWLLGNKADERMKKLIALATGLIEPTPEEQNEILDSMCEIQRLCDEKDVDLEEVKAKFRVDSLNQMTLEQMKKCISALNKKEV